MLWLINEVGFVKSFSFFVRKIYSVDMSNFSFMEELKPSQIIPKLITALLFFTVNLLLVWEWQLPLQKPMMSKNLIKETAIDLLILEYRRLISSVFPKFLLSVYWSAVRPWKLFADFSRHSHIDATRDGITMW